MTIRGDLELLARTEQVFSSVHEEFVCAARDLDTWSRPGARQAVGDGLLNRDTQQIRKLFSPASLADQHSREHLSMLVDKGARVRIAATALPHETIIIDRRFAILAGLNTPGGRAYTLTTAPTLVGSVYALFEAAWESATDLQAFLSGKHPQSRCPEPNSPARPGIGRHRRDSRAGARHVLANLPSPRRPPARRPRRGLTVPGRSARGREGIERLRGRPSTHRAERPQPGKLRSFAAGTGKTGRTNAPSSNRTCDWLRPTFVDRC
ncbi:hypothetical protein SHIRM173S_07875 [Streptomyces hirsutus]